MTAEVVTVPAADDADVSVVLELLAAAPHALGGIVLRGMPGPSRDALCAELMQLLGPGAPNVRLPLHATDDRVLGGLSLAASLQHGRPVLERGLLAAADGGVVVLSMAERSEPRRIAQLCSVLERACVSLERDGLSSEIPSRVGIVALDEGIDDERLHEALRDRLAFHIELSDLPAQGSLAESVARSASAWDNAEAAELSARMQASGREVSEPAHRALAAPSGVVSQRTGRGLPPLLRHHAASVRVERARAAWAGVLVDEAWVCALCEAALALGVVSLRAPLLAAKAAQVHAALRGRSSVQEEDVLVAARWVLGPRATQLPQPEEATADAQPEQAEPQQEPADDDASAPELDSLQELLVAAAKSGIPRQLFDSLGDARAPRARPRSALAGKAGAQQLAAGGGRPSGVRAAMPSALERLNVVETLRAAAPWQRLRGRQPGFGRVQLRKDDLRVTRYSRRSETTVIFSVDASGSAALQRLAEAKGAVEQLLIDCYARRDHVALVSFRDRTASLLLAPTRSLTRVRRSLAQLAGGGATPLASGIDAAGALALTARKQGSLPIVVLMTDARANVSRDGEHGSAGAMRDALAAARDLRGHTIASLFLDTSPRPREQAQRLATELGAHYLPLPYLDAAGIAAEVRALSTASRSRP